MDTLPTPPPVSTSMKIGIYAVSILFPPLGLWPGIKYIMKDDPQAKQVGMIAIILTIVSSVISIWLTFSLFQNYINLLNSVLY